MFDWIIEHAATLTNMGNGIWIAISLLVSYYMFRLFRRTQDETVKSLTLGITLVAISSAIHRLWWFLGILFAPVGQTYATWATDWRGILTLFVLTLAFGYSLHIKVALENRCGKLWWLRPAAAVLLGGFLGWME